jgi:hypothetical protein
VKRRAQRAPAPIIERPEPRPEPSFIVALRAVVTAGDESFFAFSRTWKGAPDTGPALAAALTHRRAVADFDREARDAIHYLETARETCARWHGIGLADLNMCPAVYALGAVKATLRAYEKACADYCAAHNEDAA